MAPLRILPRKWKGAWHKVNPSHQALYNLWIKVLDHHSQSTPIRMGWYKSNVSVGQIPLFIAKTIPFFTTAVESFHQPTSSVSSSTSHDGSIPEHVGRGTWLYEDSNHRCHVMSFLAPVEWIWVPHVTIHLLSDELLGVAHLSFNVQVPRMNKRKPMKQHCFNHHPKFRWTVM